MNLEPLFQMQKELDAHIEQQHPLRDEENWFAKKLLALQVELGELANEWRGFKFWSNNQEPRTHKRVTCHACGGLGEFYNHIFSDHGHVSDKIETCTYCEGIGIQEECNPLLEEYVDCLHFILSIGLEVELPELYGTEIDQDKIVVVVEDVTEQFLIVFEKAKMNTPYTHTAEWFALFEEFYILGKVLGFTWEQIEEAYKSKNRTNHQRQVEGY